MPGVILTSPQCGGTHAFIGFLKGLGLELVGRHRDGIWYPPGHPKTAGGRKIDERFRIPVRDGEFITGHSGPFPTRLPVVCNLRDPRDIMLCHWRRRRIAEPFADWLRSDAAVRRARTIPRHWAWSGPNVLRVWYEDLCDELVQRRIAGFCAVPWSATGFYGKGRTWSGRPSNWRRDFGAEHRQAWNALWPKVTGQRWTDWWRHHGGWE